jgi:CubicO group peptidase (beta-lactamase class C family)
LISRRGNTLARQLVGISITAGILLVGTVECAHAQLPNTLGQSYPAASHFAYEPPENVGLAADQLRQIADRVQGWVEDGEAVGAEILVIKNRRIVLHEAFGWRDRERKLGWERNTIARIRSMTKPFVGTAILMLADSGKIQLSDLVATYIPAFDNPRSRDISIEHLLTHSGGFNQPGYPQQLRSYKDLREAVDAVGQMGPPTAPGIEYGYSDAGSATLGAIVAEVSGMAVQEFLLSRIIEPLGLDDTFPMLTDGDARRSRVSSTYRRGDGRFDRYWDFEQPQVMQFFRASGGLYSTTTDYARFLAFWIDEGSIADRQLLSPALIYRALSPSPWNREYGYHWQVDPRGDPGSSDLPSFGHGGSDGTMAWANPEQDLIVCYFTQSRGGSTTGKIQQVVAEALGIRY